MPFNELFFQLIITSAPGRVFELRQITLALFLSSKVLPINIPKPKPDFSLLLFFAEDLM